MSAATEVKLSLRSISTLWLVIGCFKTSNKPVTLDCFKGDLHWDLIRNSTLHSFQAGNFNDVAGNKIHSGGLLGDCSDLNPIGPGA